MDQLICHLRKLLTPKYRFLGQFIKTSESKQNFRILDVGCGNRSPSITKQCFPFIEYYGIDKQEYNLTEEDKKILDSSHFFLIDLDTEYDKLDRFLQNDYFDFIIMNHVIEHLKNGLKVLEILSKKIKPGGGIYIEFPSVSSLSLPSMEGTLHFCDDPTHVRIYTIPEIVNVLLENNFKIIKAGKRRMKLRIILLPIILLGKLILRKEITAGVFWDLFGFADFVFAQKLK